MPSIIFKMKKITFLSFLFCLAFGIALAQTEGISYQAVLVDNNPDEIPGIDVPSNNIPNQELNVRFTILNSFGDTDYQETQNTQTDDYGVINLMIGEGIPTGQGLGSFTLINWDGPKTLEVAIDLEGGNNFSPFSSQSLTYVPYVRHRDIIADGSLNVNSISNLNDDVTIAGATMLQNDLGVQGVSRFLDRVRIDAIGTSTDQSNFDAYPLQLRAGSHGMAIQLNQAIPTKEHNFMSFWNSNKEPIGRIEGFQAFNEVSQNFIFEVLFQDEPSIDEAKEEEDDDTAPPTEAPNALDRYLINDYSLTLLLEYIDLLEASATFGWNLGACIGGLAVLGDCDDAAWSLISIIAQGVQISLHIRYNEINKGTTFESGGADYAEWLKKHDKKENLTFGDIIGVRSGEISSKFVSADKFMVISKNPIVSGAMPKESDEHLYKKVAFIGQVPVKVLGAVNKGDYILPSGNGDGMAIAVHPDQMRINDYKRIVGVAWEEYHGQDLFSFINTAVGINSNDLTNEIIQMQVLLNQMQDALVQANPNYQPNFFNVETVSVAKNTKTTKSKTIQQLVFEQYGIDNTATTKEKFTQLSSLMAQEDVENQNFKFSDMPYLNEVLENPSEENIAKYNAYYSKALQKLKSIVATRTTSN